MEKREMKFTSVEASVIRETEKAYQLTVSYWTKHDAPSKEAKMWCPKSCCKVSNGEVTDVADFILNKWVDEHNEYIRQRTHKVPNICFDMAHKACLIERDKQEREEWERRRAEVLEKAYNAALQPATEFMQEIGCYCSGLGEYMISKDRGNVDKCNQLIALGKKIAAEFGDYKESSVEEYVQKLNESEEFENMSNKEFANLFYRHYDTNWVFGEFRPYHRETCLCNYGFTTDDFHRFFGNYPSTNPYGDFGKKFKKNLKFFNEFKDIFYNGLFKLE